MNARGVLAEHGGAGLRLPIVSVRLSSLSSKVEIGMKSPGSFCPLIVREKDRFSGFPLTEMEQDPFRGSSVHSESWAVGSRPRAGNSDYFVPHGGARALLVFLIHR